MSASYSPSGRFRLKLLALAVGAATLPAMAATETRQTATSPASNEQTLTVTATADSQFTPGGDKLVPAYLDGQVANGGRMGMLGQQDARNVPFNIVSYTSKLIQDQQAKTIKDVVANDASIQNVQGYGNFAETYRIRGFDLNGDDMTFGGLSGVMPRQVVSTQMVERVEVFKGANALMNGSASSGVGGMINLEPKHADDVPLTRVGVDYTGKNQLGASIDAGRRFGDNNQWGARVNLLDREGETAVDNEKRRTTLASIGLDYRGDRLRTSLDMGYQKQAFHGGRLGVNVSGVDFIPEVPKATSNYSQDWVYSNLESEFGMARAEYYVAPDWTLYGALGGQHSHEYGAYGTPKLTDASGNAVIGRMDTNKFVDAFSGQAGIRGQFATGVVNHSVNLGYSAMNRREKTSYGMAKAAEAVGTNIYEPSAVNPPEMTSFGGDLNSPRPTSRVRSQGFLLSDTLGMFDDKLLLTLGARHQKVVVRNYYYGTAIEKDKERFTKNRWTPAYGIVFKPWESISLYANHIESLSPGETAPSTATANPGTVSGISLAKQNEVGVKFDSGRVGGSLALFEIKKPKGLTNPETKYFSLDGEQRNRGVELNVFGEPVFGLRLNGSATWLDPKMTKTQNGTNDGKNAVGVAEFYTVLGAEYDIKPIDGLTATARLTHSGSQYANAANTKKLDAYTTLDLGARYRMKVQDNDLVWRVGVDNVTNKRYWSGVESGGTYIYQGTPRQLKVSMSYDF
ncbi:TonB-dependent receptor [Pantoea coffeiphila]|uniref:TonB-dependent receptor n=1 Tax=Pantoea coffeiphila TaxID=1465635 RepID=UPI00195F7B9A|nr:TonB-dependent siderophore receptor [Pantoea coffeiphila]MBM7344513.1 iron complex outermembrane receptor protein [Pantoea coffeiphila]